MTAPVSYSTLFVSLLGGLGLFLLGMTMLSDGLKLAAGRALERMLEAWHGPGCMGCSRVFC